MSLPQLRMEPLTREAFAPFGKILHTEGNDPQEINEGRTRKYAGLAAIDAAESSGTPVVHIYRSKPIELPFRIRMMECHPLGSQTFIPLHDRPFLVVVAPAATELEPGSIRGFITNGKQGVHLDRGVWHHYQLTLGGTSDYAVIEREGPGRNTIEQELTEPLIIEI